MTEPEWKDVAKKNLVKMTFSNYDCDYYVLRIEVKTDDNTLHIWGIYAPAESNEKTKLNWRHSMN